MTVACASPIAWETLVDYWAGELPPGEADAVEEHLFACATCTAASCRVAAVTETLRAAVLPAVTRRRLDALRARGHRIDENGFSPGERREVDFAPDTEFLVHRLEGLELEDAERVSFRIVAESTGEPISELEAVPFEPAEGAVLIACQRHFASLPPDTVFDVFVHTTSGAIRTAKYTILHRYG
jgi:hypothetical protein